jgi:hypothetical protein
MLLNLRSANHILIIIGYLNLHLAFFGSDSSFRQLIGRRTRLRDVIFSFVVIWVSLGYSSLEGPFLLIHPILWYST